MVRVLLPPCVLLAASLPVQAGTSVYSRLDKPSCRSAISKLAPREADHALVVERCRTAVGYEIVRVYLGTHMQVTVGRPERATAINPQLGAGYDLGEMIEWRGPYAPTFTPMAAIMRLQSRDPEGRVRSVLGVLRVAGEVICPAAFLDAGANPEPNLLARRTADEVAKSFRCGVDRPRIVGVESELVRETAARSPRSP